MKLETMTVEISDGSEVEIYFEAALPRLDGQMDYAARLRPVKAGSLGDEALQKICRLAGFSFSVGVR